MSNGKNSDEPLPLAISYYQIYCDIAVAARSTNTSATISVSNKNEGVTAVAVSTTLNERRSSDDDDKVKSDPQQEQTANYGQQQPWVEDTEWDAIREAAAERELWENMARCRISTGTTTTSFPNTPSTAAAWDQFYQHHQTSFFKDRHWPAVAFPNEFLAKGGVLVEVGCGVGNTLLPLLEKKIKTSCAAGEEEDRLNGLQDYCWTVYGLDLSPAAIDLLQRDDRFQQAQSDDRAFSAVVDIAQPCAIPRQWTGVATVTSLLFCLSAVDPVHQGTAVANAVATLRPGGILVLRDYGRYDEAQMKLGRQRHKLLRDNFYRKHDGTYCYYFTIERIRELFLNQSTMMEELECHYIRRVYTNRLEQTERRRVWVHARFRKKESSALTPKTANDGAVAV